MRAAASLGHAHMRRTVVAGGYAALLLRERRAAMLAMVRKKGMCARVAFADGDDGGGKASTSRWEILEGVWDPRDR